MAAKGGIADGAHKFTLLKLSLRRQSYTLFVTCTYTLQRTSDGSFECRRENEARQIFAEQWGKLALSKVVGLSYNGKAAVSALDGF